MPRGERDVWRVPTLCLWMVFLAVGLFPEATFLGLRALGRVMPQHALVNSPFLLTLLLAVFLGVFTWHRCTLLQMAQPEAQDKGLHLTIIGLVAFLPVDFASIAAAHSNPLIQHLLLIYAGGVAKLMCWVYVLFMILRCYLLDCGRALGKTGSADSQKNEKGDNSLSQ